MEPASETIFTSPILHRHVLALKALQEGRGVSSYNLGMGRGFSVHEVVRTALAVTERSIAVREGSRRLGSGPIKSRDSFWASIVIPSSDGGICDERFVLADASATCATGTAFSIVARQASGGRFAGVSGIIFVIKNGLRWRDAPKDYGPHKTLYNRFIRWSRMGVFNKIFASLAAEAGPPERLMIDSTHLKAHRTASSLLKKGLFHAVSAARKAA